MKETLEYIIELLLQLNVIDISKYDETFLNKSIQKRIEVSNCKSVQDYCLLLEKDNEERLKLVNSLHNSYSEFFRNPLTFSVLERIILPELISKMKNSKRKEIRIWSTACASGQEVYSLAMLLEECCNGQRINYRIFATDKNPSQLSLAVKGHFLPSSLTFLSMKRLNQWFTQQAEVYTIKQELKEHIDFSVFDLFNDELGCPSSSIFGDFDLVVCANLLFYYKNQYREAILGKASKCLSINGYLITGETEREILMHHNYHEAYPQSAIFRKMEFA